MIHHPQSGHPRPLPRQRTGRPHRRSRPAVPRAPPHTLCLEGAEFLRFRQPGRFANPANKPADATPPPPDNFSVISDLTGPRLTLRDGGRAAQVAFREEVLFPALGPLCRHADWADFATELEEFRMEDADLEWLRAQVAEWRRNRPERGGDARGVEGNDEAGPDGDPTDEDEGR